MRLISVIILSTFLNDVSLAESFFREYLIDPQDGKLDASRYLSEIPMGFLPVPALITEPAVGTGLGVAGIFFHESDEQKRIRLESIQETHKAILPNSISFIGLAATDNGTVAGGLGHIGFWQQDRVRYKGFLLYPDANLDFYSLNGQALPGDQGIEFSLKGPVVLQELKARIASNSNVFIGARQIHRKVDLSLANAESFAPFESEQENQQLQEFLHQTAQADITTSGIGALLEYDSRNNPFNPERGHFLRARYQWFDDALDSDLDYADFNLTSINHWALSSTWLLGLRLQMDGVIDNGDSVLPPYVLPFVDLRGIPKARYQDERVAVVEAQLDWRVTPRWKVSVFSGSGKTAAHTSDLVDGDSSETFGTGFRYLLARRYGFTMGVDVAAGPEETVFYIQAGSVW